MFQRSHSSVLAAAVLLSGCAGTVAAPQHLATEVYTPAFHNASDNARARTELRDAAGNVVGTARFAEDAEGRVQLTVRAKGLTPGLHGLHLHAVGICGGSAAPAFSSAGGHVNPAGKEHGQHNGDLPNLVVNNAGVGHLSTSIERFRLAELFDTDGTALVLHQNEDDLVTDKGPLGPGNSGPRIACGIVEAN